jgi:hypothetical protein
MGEVIDVEVDSVPDGQRLGVPEMVPDAVRAMQAAAEKVKLQMDAKWEEERRERDRWKLEDKRDAFFARLVSHMAAAVISEGAAGVRPKPQHVASMAVEYANAVMEEIDKDFKRKAEVASAAAAAASVRK